MRETKITKPESSAAAEYICGTCDAKFASLFKLAEHGNIHTGNKPFACSVCMEKFQLLAEYTSHYLDKHSVCCQNCNDQFRDDTAYQQHLVVCPGVTTVDMTVLHEIAPENSLAIKKENEDLVCDKCGHTFKSKGEIARHACSKRKPILCSCLQVFNEINEFRDHIGASPFSCCACEMKFPAISNLIIHNRIHSKEKPFSCSVCNRGFSQMTHLRNHESTHLAIKAIHCDLCSFSCKTPNGLFKHLQKHKKGESGQDKRKVSTRMHMCLVCGKSFRFQRNLAMHITSHGTFLCPICGGVFDTQKMLSLHMRRRHGENRTCEICDKEFKGVSALSTHMKTHIAQKEHICPTCGKRFALRSYLRSHVRTHDARPTYTCNSCGKVFKVPQGLKYHLKGNRCIAS